MPVFLLVAFTVNVSRKSLSCAIENNGDWLFKIKRKHRNFKHLRTVKNSTIHSRPQEKNTIWRVTIQSVLFVYARDR